MKKILKWVGIGFAALLVVTIAGAWAMVGTFVKAAQTFILRRTLHTAMS